MTIVLAVVAFPPLPGVSEEAFREVVARSMQFIERQPGFLSREVGVATSGEWSDLIRPADQVAASRAAEHFDAAAETREFADSVVRQAVQGRHFRLRPSE